MSTEIEIMKRIRHIVSMYELYETPKCLWIILELVNSGGLHHYMAHVDLYSEVLISSHFKQVSHALLMTVGGDIRSSQDSGFTELTSYMYSTHYLPSCIYLFLHIFLFLFWV